jgi:hypothetical protein
MNTNEQYIMCVLPCNQSPRKPATVSHNLLTLFPAVAPEVPVAHLLIASLMKIQNRIDHPCRRSPKSDDRLQVPVVRCLKLARSSLIHV